MAEADTQAKEQCKALTEGGERCSRPARDDGFCYQHDEDDPTIDESDAEDEDGETRADEDAETETGDGDASETEETESMSETQTETEREEAEETGEDRGGTAIAGGAEETTDPGEVDADVDPDEEGIASILEIRRTVESTAGELIGYEFDGVSEISPTEDGWRGIVEVVERSSIPDTMDILGRYEIDLSEDGTVRGYRRIDRYHRNDTDEFVE